MATMRWEILHNQIPPLREPLMLLQAQGDLPKLIFDTFHHPAHMDSPPPPGKVNADGDGNLRIVKGPVIRVLLAVTSRMPTVANEWSLTDEHNISLPTLYRPALTPPPEWADPVRDFPAFQSLEVLAAVVRSDEAVVACIQDHPPGQYPGEGYHVKAAQLAIQLLRTGSICSPSDLAVLVKQLGTIEEDVVEKYGAFLQPIRKALSIERDTTDSQPTGTPTTVGLADLAVFSTCTPENWQEHDIAREFQNLHKGIPPLRDALVVLGRYPLPAQMWTSLNEQSKVESPDPQGQRMPIVGRGTYSALLSILRRLPTDPENLYGIHDNVTTCMIPLKTGGSLPPEFVRGDTTADIRSRVHGISDLKDVMLDYVAFQARVEDKPPGAWPLIPWDGIAAEIVVHLCRTMLVRDREQLEELLKMLESFNECSSLERARGWQK